MSPAELIQLIFFSIELIAKLVSRGGGAEVEVATPYKVVRHYLESLYITPAHSRIRQSAHIDAGLDLGRPGSPRGSGLCEILGLRYQGATGTAAHSKPMENPSEDM